MAQIIISNLSSTPLLSGFSVEGINLKIYPAQKIALVGSSGSGKTTLLKMIAGLLQFASGDYKFNDQKILGPDHKLMPGIKGIAYLSQSSDLWNNYWIEDILDYANQFGKDETDELCKLCKIDHLLRRNSKQLSGGERQRIALVKLLLERPQVLILDEPYTNLDLIHKKILQEVVDSICKKFHITCILSSHNAIDILSWADEVLVMQEGKIIERNYTKQIYDHAEHIYTAKLFGEINEIDAELKEILNITSDIKYLRPHQLIVHEKGKIQAEVIDQEYRGSYYLTKIKIADHILYIGHDCELEINSKVCLYINH